MPTTTASEALIRTTTATVLGRARLNRGMVARIITEPKTVPEKSVTACTPMRTAKGRPAKKGKISRAEVRAVKPTTSAKSTLIATNGSRGSSVSRVKAIPPATRAPTKAHQRPHSVTNRYGEEPAAGWRLAGDIDLISIRTG